MTSIISFYTISVFLAGLISFFAPCIIPLLPVYVSTLSSGSELTVNKQGINWRLVAQTFVFVLGLGTTFIILGFGAGALGGLLTSRIFLYICGGIVIILGLHQTGIFHILFLDREKRLEIPQNQKNNVLTAYLLGLTFSFGWTPCVGPVLATVLALSSSGNQAFYGAFLMLVYTLGLAVPFLLVSFFTDFLVRSFRKVNKYLPKIRVVGGILIIAMGIALMTDNLNSISTLFIFRN